MKEIPDTCDNTTAKPVYYATGGARMLFNDFLGSPPAALVTDLSRTWSNVSQTADGQRASFGSGSSFSGLSYIAPFTNPNLWTAGQSFVVVSDGRSHAVFQDYFGNYFSTGQGELSKYKYTVNATTGHIFETKPDGTVTEYVGLLGGGAAAGEMVGRTSASGDTMTTMWDATGTQPTSIDFNYTQRSGGTSTAMSESYAFTYAPGTNRVTQVVQSRNGTPVRTVGYAYYGTGDANGNDGDLKTVTKRNGGPTSAIVEVNYSRWYTSNTSTGYVGGLKFYVGDTARQKVLLDNPSSAIESISDATLLNYADNYFEYDTNGTDHRVTKEVASGAGAGCSCGKTGEGTYTLAYSTNPSTAALGGRNVWRTKTLETLPDGNQNTVYTNAAGQIILKVATETATAKQYLTWTLYDVSGNVIRSAEGNAVTGFSESFGDLVGYGQSGTTLAATGRIDVTNYFDAFDGVDVDLYRYKKNTGYQIGATGAFVPTESWSYTDGGVTGDGVYYPLTDTTYPDATSLTGARVMTYDYESWWQVGGVNTAQAKVVATHLAQVSAAQNGADASTGGSSSSNYVTRDYLDSAGRRVWSVDGQGFLTYYEYDPKTSAVVRQVMDVDPSTVTTAAVAAPTRAAGLAAAKNLVLTYEIDDQGRTTKRVDPNGVVAYTVYDDATTDGDPRSVTTYAGWNATTHQPTGPVHATITDPATGITDDVTYTYSASGGLPVDGSGRPTGAESLGSSYVTIQSLTRSIANVSGQRIEQRAYTNVSGLTYDPTSSGWATLGTSGTNFLSTKYKYDSASRLFQTTTPDGTISTTVFDVRGLAMSTWKGTNNTGATEADPTGGATAGNNMVKVSGSVYDASGNRIESRAYFGNNTSDYYATRYQYDARNRMIGAVGPDSVGTRYTLDNQGEQTRVETFANTTVNADGTLNYGAASNLRGQVDNAYDDQGRVYRTTTYNVPPTTGVPGTVGNSLAQNTWYDRRGNVVKVANANGLSQKTLYDGVGRVISSYASYDDAETSWADALTITGDTVISEQDVTYVGNWTALTASYDRTAASGTTTGRLTPTTARLSANVMWYDASGRMIGTGAYGIDPGHLVVTTAGAPVDANSDGVPDLYAAGVPTTNTSGGQLIVLLAKTAYDAAGRVLSTTDNKGHVTRYSYDVLGRKTSMIENYVDGVASETETDTDRTTQWIYDRWGRLYILRALNPQGTGLGVQREDTQYFYASDVDRSWVSFTIYPDSGNDRDLDANGNVDVNQDAPVDFDWDASGRGFIDTNSPNAVDFVADTYDRLGRKVTSTDQRGVVHGYTYDSKGRLSKDAVTSLGRSDQSVDGSVLSIGYGYDDLSRQQTVTSYSDAAGTTVANQVMTTYDGWGNVSKSQQSHAGAVTGTTPSVNYTYDDGAVSGAAKYVRLSKVTYPNGRDLFYLYGGSDAANNKLGRIYEIGGDASDSNATYDARFFYAGTGTLVRETRDNGHSKLDFDPTNDGTMSGFDRFGRIVGQMWSQNTTPAASAATWAAEDATAYAYDANSNRTNRVTSTNGAGISDPNAYQQSYAYDGLDRLTSSVDSKPTTSGSTTTWTTTDGQSWGGLDALGNWRSSSTDTNGDGVADTTQTRSNNAANEITSVSGSTWGDPTYDAAGNETRLPTAAGSSDVYQLATYDAWNRQVGVVNYTEDEDDDAYASNEYDGLGHRIVSSTNGGDAYFDENWQLLETRDSYSHATNEQDVWDPRYVDALIRQDKDIVPDNGSLDTSFGTGGHVVLNASAIGGNDSATATLVQPDGKLVVAGSYNDTFGPKTFVARYRTDGTLDPTFGTNGLAYVTDGSFIAPFAVALTADGKIVFCGYRWAGGPFVVRLNADGSRDATYGSNGIAGNATGLPDGTFTDLAVDGAGRVVLVGSDGGGDETVVRFLADGSGVDTTFGSSASPGMALVDFGATSGECATGVALDAAGRILVSGYSGNDATIARLTTSGTLDTTFNTTGKVLFLPGGWTTARANDIKLDANGKVVFGGWVTTSGYNVLVGRLNADGSFDASLNGVGYATHYVTYGNADSYALDVQPDGKVLLGGTAGYNAAVYRFNADGSFDYVQTLSTGSATSEDSWKAIAFDVDHVYLAGISDYNSSQNTLIAKYNAGPGLEATYVQQDANYDVTSITDDQGRVIERYRYTAYGERTVLKADGTAAADLTNSRYGFAIGHQGGRIDTATGLIDFRHREYSASLGRWVTRDPKAYIDGFSLYQYVNTNPLKYKDPTGTCKYCSEKKVDWHFTISGSSFGMIWQTASVSVDATGVDDTGCAYIIRSSGSTYAGGATLGFGYFSGTVNDSIILDNVQPLTEGEPASLSFLQFVGSAGYGVNGVMGVAGRLHGFSAFGMGGINADFGGAFGVKQTDYHYQRNPAIGYKFRNQ